ncbi:hypothetical protein QNI19_36775 [Cytophagaceae bacterium DM2B3-1]|uniref:Uncharacterized protein n=1 Tax=Xanthocytophaga flava TaxID=3048013 RepID=A0ABT7D183_9BACT|nr:hypothetical protein [Xanthocytophaga flavus]MDJ1472813.1 hypothetical protein [Xanthocytophaga flavus]MDJ1498549.1 hypothetical protein [Xanthocytophaga flavus]
MKKSFIIIFLTFCVVVSYAQSGRRVEIQARTKAENMHIVPVESEGVVLFSEADRGKYVFTRYNTDLQQDWSVDCLVNPSLDLTRYVYRNKALYLLFSRYKTPIYQVVKLNVRAGFAAKYEFSSIDRLDIIDFDAIDNNIFMAGKTRNEPVLVRINLLERQTKVLPTAFRARTDLQSIEADSVHGVINAVFVTTKGKDKNVFIKTYSPEGNVLHNVTLTADKEIRYDLLGGKVSNLDSTNQLVIGTFGTQGPVYSRTSTYNYWGMGQGSVFTGTADYSQGLYITKLQEGQEKFTRYYSFTDFKNFFKFMSGRQQEKMAARIEKQKKKGKDLKLQYRLLVHDIIQRNNQYIMIAEAYYPEYRNSNSGFGSPMVGGFGMGGFGIGFGSPWSYGPYSGYRSYPVFDGYVYTHAVIAGFDLQGNLLWDNSFEINDVKTFVLKEKVKVNFDSNDQVTLAYNQGGKLRTKVIRGTEVVEGKESVQLSTEYTGDKIKRSLTDDIEYWYGNHFLAWGYQRIRNDENAQARGRREVFYLEKVDL